MVRKNPTITDSAAGKLDKSVRDAHKKFTPYEEPVPVVSRRRMPRPRPGSEKVSAVVLDAATQFAFELPDRSIASIREEQAAAERLRPLLASVAALHKAVSDAVFCAESRAWGGTTHYYSVLNRIAKANEPLRTALQPAIDFFARRSPAVREDRSITRAQRKADRAQKAATDARKAADARKTRRAGARQPAAGAGDGGVPR